MQLRWLIPFRSREAYGCCDIPQADSRDSVLGCPRDPVDRRRTGPDAHLVGRDTCDHRTRPFPRAKTPRNSPDPYKRHGKQYPRHGATLPAPVYIPPNLQGIPRVRVLVGYAPATCAKDTRDTAFEHWIDTLENTKRSKDRPCLAIHCTLATHLCPGRLQLQTRTTRAPCCRHSTPIVISLWRI